MRLIQERRKDLDCQYTDRIEVTIGTDADELAAAVRDNTDYIRNETLVVALNLNGVDEAQPANLQVGDFSLSLIVKVVPMSTTPKLPLPIAVLISGGGTTLRNLLAKRRQGELEAEVRLVISTNPQSPGLQLAADAAIRHLVIPRHGYATTDAFSTAVFDACRAADVQLVVMGGFLKRVRIPPDYVGRVMNIHPALIPAFCGKGFYGERVHEAVLQFGAKVSGCTVHFADDQYDHGPIIVQRSVPVLDDDTPHTLASRVFEQECQAYPEAINLFAQGRLRLEGRRVRIDAAPHSREAEN